MRISVILAHPDNRSFNHAIAETALKALTSNGHHCHYHDLYKEKFDPLLPSQEIPKAGNIDPSIAAHCQQISTVDGIIIVHPNWWGQPPAVLKGWIDRVFRPGVTYEFEEGDQGEGIPVGLLRAKRAVVFNTSNTNAKREIEVFGDPLETLWKNCIFGLCGIHHVYRHTFSVMVTSTLAQRQGWLEHVTATVHKYFSSV